jgi:hypothetical protein
MVSACSLDQLHCWDHLFYYFYSLSSIYRPVRTVTMASRWPFRAQLAIFVGGRPKIIFLRTRPMTHIAGRRPQYQCYRRTIMTVIYRYGMWMVGSTIPTTILTINQRSRECLKILPSENSDNDTHVPTTINIQSRAGRELSLSL